MKKKSVLALIDERVGNNNQVIDLTNKLSDGDFQVKKLEYNFWSFLPSFMLISFPMHLKFGILEGIFYEFRPDIIISAGRRTSPVSIYLKNYLKKEFNHHADSIQVMNSGINYTNFKYVISPYHDNPYKYAPENNLRIIGALNDVKKKIADHKLQFKTDYPKLNKFIAVLIGGSSRRYKFTDKQASILINSLKKLSSYHELDLFITFSRRTPKSVIELFQNDEYIKNKSIIYNPSNSSKSNPYPAMLGEAEYIISTADSVSMCSEAVGTGKPVYIFCPEEFKLKRHRLFLNHLVDNNFARYLDIKASKLEKYQYEPLDELSRVSKIIRNNLIK